MPSKERSRRDSAKTRKQLQRADSCSSDSVVSTDSNSSRSAATPSSSGSRSRQKTHLIEARQKRRGQNQTDTPSTSRHRIRKAQDSPASSQSDSRDASLMSESADETTRCVSLSEEFHVLNIDVRGAEDEEAGQQSVDVPSQQLMPPPRRSVRLTRGIPPTRYRPASPPKKWPEPKKVSSGCKNGHKGYGCGAASAGHHPNYYDSLAANWVNCPYCKALLLGSEAGTSKCCAQGKVALLTKFLEYCERPKEMEAIMYLHGADSEHFLKFAKIYNDEFSFGSLRTVSDNPIPGGAQVIKINGQTYQGLKGIHPRLDPNAPEDDPWRPLNQLFTLDVADGVQQRLANVAAYTASRKPKENNIRDLHECLAKHHAMAKLYRCAKEIYDDAKAQYEAAGQQMPRFRIRFYNKEQAVAAGVPGAVQDRQCALPAELGLEQLAQVYMETGDQQADLPVKQQGLCLTGKTGEEIAIPWWNRIACPALFPIIFCKGQTGYEQSIKLNLPPAQQGAQPAQQRPQSRADSVCDAGDDAVDVPYDDHEYGEGEQLLMDKEIKRHEFVSATMFWRYLMQIRCPKGKRTRDWRRKHWLWEWRGQLSELLVCTILNRIDSHKYNEAKKAQGDLRSVLPQVLINALDNRAKGLGWNGVGKIYFASEHIRGSRKFYQRAYADCMTICRKFGKPHLMLTYTMSSECPELAQMKREGQSWNDRADLIGRLFIDKVSELKHDIVDLGVLGPVASWFFTVEHQTRGLPHIHMIITLRTPDNKPANWDDIEDGDWNPMTLSSVDYITQYIQTELPEWPAADDRTNAAKLQREYIRLVREKMYHTCSDGYCKGVTGRCTKRFPQPHSQHVVVSDEAYPMYKRRPNAPSEEARQKDPEQYAHKHVRQLRGADIELDNALVVPHNKFVLCKYKSHINVEWLEGDACIKYVLKYITKGTQKAFAGLHREDNRADFDEYEEIKAARFVTANEAFLSLMGYPLVHKSHGVDVLYIHLPYQTHVIYHEGTEEEVGEREREAMEQGIVKKTSLTEYFALNQRLAQENQKDVADAHTYFTIHEQFYWSKQKKLWIARKNRSKRLVRIGSAAPGNQEAQALRALLLHVHGPTCFDDLRGAPGMSFWDSAVAAGLCEGNELWKRTAKDAMIALREAKDRLRWFAVFLATVRPAHPQQLLDELWDQIHPANKTRAQVMKVIEYLLRKNGIHPDEQQLAGGLYQSACEAIGLDRPAGYAMTPDDWIDADFGMQGWHNAYFGDCPDLDDQGVASIAGNYSHLYSTLKGQQKGFVDHVMDSTLEMELGRKPKANIKRLFFLTGDGGVGKSYVYNTLIAGLHDRQKRVMVTASTGIAANLLRGGGTVHSRFRVSNDVDDKTLPTVGRETAFATSLRKCDVIICDEVSMQHRHVLEYVDRLLRDVHSVSDPESAALPFGGKIVIIGGDWKQLMPVVPGGNEAAQYSASVKQSEFFKEFETTRLTENMRVDPASMDYLEKLKMFGTGVTIDDYGFDAVPANMFVKQRRELIDHVFPTETFEDPINNVDMLSGRAILCPTNAETFKMNDEIMELIRRTDVDASTTLPVVSTPPIKIYTSIDKALQDNPEDMLAVNVADRDLENIYRKTPTGLPQHEIRLKVGAIVMVIKNISVADGICNGTRVMVIELKDDVIVCQHIMGRHKGDKFALYRCKFSYGGNERRTAEGEGGVRWERIQFPIRPGFALTVNKSQGQTLERVGLMLQSGQCFSHGQLYVALSRVRREDDIRILTDTSNAVRNVVMQMIIDQEEIEDAVKLAVSKNIAPRISRHIATPTVPLAQPAPPAQITTLILPRTTSPFRPQLPQQTPQRAPQLPPQASRTLPPPPAMRPSTSVAVAQHLPLAEADFLEGVPEENRRKFQHEDQIMFEDVRGDGDCFFSAIIRFMHGYNASGLTAFFTDDTMQDLESLQQSLRRACIRLMLRRYHFADEEVRGQMILQVENGEVDLRTVDLSARSHQLINSYAARMFRPAEGRNAGWADAFIDGLYAAQVLGRHIFVLREHPTRDPAKRSLRIISPGYVIRSCENVDLQFLLMRRFATFPGSALQVIPNFDGNLLFPNPICIQLLETEGGLFNHFKAAHILSFTTTTNPSVGRDRLYFIPEVPWTPEEESYLHLPSMVD